MNLPDLLAEHRLMAIIRGRDPEACERTAHVLVDAGVRLLEVSLTSVDAMSVLRSITESLGKVAHIGAGTVLTAGDAERAQQAGATFAVIPALSDGVAAARALGMPVLAGAMTPTEVLAAHQAGAAAVKVFPAGVLGPSYLRALGDPFPKLGLVPVGGVGLGDVAPYFAAGALAVGIGSPLTGDAPHGGDLRTLRERADLFLAAAHDGIGA